MLEELRVHVPADLARELEEDGIEELERVRSLDWLAQDATIAVTAVGTAANLTTILLAKDAVARFIHEPRNRVRSSDRVPSPCHVFGSWLGPRISM